jgi:hypothetical protein
VSAPTAAERRAQRDRELAAHVVRVVDAAPALSNAQADALALMFRRPRDTRGAA